MASGKEAEDEGGPGSRRGNRAYWPRFRFDTSCPNMTAILGSTYVRRQRAMKEEDIRNWWLDEGI